MRNEEKNKTENFQQKSHEVLLKILNNIGIIGAILCGIAEIIVVIIFVVGLDIKKDNTSNILFSIINALIGTTINILLRYQGQKYAELENADLCRKYYRNKVEKEKKHLPLVWYNVIMIVKDIIIKGCGASFSIFGVIYISIEGSKNPIEILMTLLILVLFSCFGLINMNNAYCRYYNVQVPYMQKQIKEMEEKENGTN